jgi:hypothetical protein
MNQQDLNLNQIPWFLPTLYGDIKLTAQGSQTEVEWENLSPSERAAMDALGKKFTVDTSPDVGKLLIAKPVDKVEKLLATSMKRGRKLLSAVVFKNGKIEELHRTEKEGAVAAIVTKAEDAVAETAAKAAVTVAQPTMSCPVPEFERAQVRATRVLREFLTPRQIDDFERTQQFLVVGADSGHRYIVTSRQAPAAVLDKVGGRSVYDCTRGMAVCVHDWTVPAAEEMLELALFLQMPGREHHVSELAFEPLH